MNSPRQSQKSVGKFNFSYVAKDANNKVIKGELFAENKTTAQLALKKQGFTDIKIELIKEPSFLVKFFAKKTASYSDITIFTRQLATMQSSGIPIVQGLKLVIDGTSKATVARLINKIKNEIESGGSLSEALRHHPSEFDELYCNLVEAGESSGNLDAMLQRIATYREKTESLRGKIKKAMYYPAAVLVVAFIVTTILLIKVVPTFKTMFEGFGAKLPAFTNVVLNISDALQHNGIKVGVTIFVAIWALRRMYRSNRRFREGVQRLLLRLPIFGSILHKESLARFTRTLATTFAAGVPLPDALLLVSKTSGNVVYKNAALKIREGVSVGKKISASMNDARVFPGMVIQMVSMGEETGTLEAMLLRVATIYEDQVDVAVDALASLIEPLIMVVLGIIVGGLVIAMYLPIFKMGSVF